MALIISSRTVFGAIAILALACTIFCPASVAEAESMAPAHAPAPAPASDGKFARTTNTTPRARRTTPPPPPPRLSLWFSNQWQWRGTSCSLSENLSSRWKVSIFLMIMFHWISTQLLWQWGKICWVICRVIDWPGNRVRADAGGAGAHVPYPSARCLLQLPLLLVLSLICQFIICQKERVFQYS